MSLWFEELKKEKDACYTKVKARYTRKNPKTGKKGTWPSAYGSGALVQCRKVGVDNWGKSIKKANPLKTWFNQSAKGEEGEPEVTGWVSCQSCEDDKKGTKPCGREDASKGTKQRCRPTCAACKTYKRRKGNKRSRGRGFTR